MELFICNLPADAKELELERLVQPILHGPRFKRYMQYTPYNFLIRFFKSKQRLFGNLSVPSKVIGERALKVFQESPLDLRGNRIFFVKSRYEPKADDLIRLSEPYQDPEIAEAEARRHRALSGVTRILRIAFGWPSHDNTLHIEWEGEGSDFGLSIQIASEDHRLVLKSLYKHWRVIVTFRNIQHMAQGTKSCAIQLSYPPILEGDPVLYPSAKRSRLSSLDDTNTAKNPFAYLSTIWISFEDFKACRAFHNKAIKVGIKVLAKTHKARQTDLFSTVNFKIFDQWLGRLPFKVAFQLDGLVARGHFHPNELLELLEDINSAIHQYGEDTTGEYLRLLEPDRERDRETPTVDLFKNRLSEALRTKTASLSSYSQSEDTFQCYRVVITPTSIIPNGPLPDETNRVLRQYKEHQSNFLRVEFRDEDGLDFRWEKDVDGGKFISERFGHILKNGFEVAGRKYELLAYSSSALKDHAVWCMTPFELTQSGETKLITADFIRASLGDFSRIIKCPARYGARLSQAFSATEPSAIVDITSIKEIPDLESSIRSCYTDGVGTISPDLADEMWRKYTSRKSKQRLRDHAIPSAFQIRMAGYKGMLCVDASLSGRVMCLRPSMNKFYADHNIVEIARAFDCPMPMFLNRCLVMLLETLGVPKKPFMELQEDAVKKATAAAQSFESAAKLFEQHGLGSSFHMVPLLLQLNTLGFNNDTSNQDQAIFEFLSRVINFAVNHVLRDLKYRARIPVPNAWTLVGVADEWNYLNEGQIYACVQTADGCKEYINGPVLISRPPTVHPGDARMVQAVGELSDSAPQALRNITNCVVFPCKGQRSLPSMLGGGDLDGDTYNLIMDERLHPPRQHPPGDYTPAELVTLDRPSTASDLVDFVTSYIQNDILGIIANQLLLTADLSKDCMADPNCLKLADLHSVAVDFAKSGQHADFNNIPWQGYESKPDWYVGEAGHYRVKTYRSQRHIGHLYRVVQLPALAEAKTLAQKQRHRLEWTADDSMLEALINSKVEDTSLLSRLLKQRIEESTDVDNIDIDTERTIQDMLNIHAKYSEQLMHICTIHSLSKWTPLSEEEAVAGTIVAKTSQAKLRRDHVADLRRTSGDLYLETRGRIKGNDQTPPESTLLRAWTAWKVSSMLKDRFGAMSFGLLALDLAFAIMRKMETSDPYL